MTLEAQIALTRRVLEMAQEFRATLDHVEGEAKADLQARADANVTKIADALRDLEALVSLQASQETIQ